MSLTNDQSVLLDWVVQDNVGFAEISLQQGVNPNFFDAQGDTPLREAIRNHNLKMVRLLVKHGADVNLALPGKPLPLDHADELVDVLCDDKIVAFLMGKKAVRLEDLTPDGEVPDVSPATVQDAAAIDKLKETFNPQNWAGKLQDMKQAWQDVPDDMKASFDFDRVLADVRRNELKAGANIFKKKPPTP